MSCRVDMLTSTAGKTGLEKEQEFIRKCMESLLMASANLEKDAHSSLTSIERGLLMLKTHLEAFRRRYATGPPRTRLHEDSDTRTASTLTRFRSKTHHRCYGYGWPSQSLLV